MQRPDVNLDPSPIYSGDTVTISYKGLLAKSGADQVYLHCGTSTGDNQWQNVNDIKMDKSDDGYWRAQTKVPTGNNLNFCFKDSANNWDNNSGHNWSQKIN
ncbi:hypothetical protein JCM16358_07910 [Halanaerocella petrolearia]